MTYENDPFINPSETDTSVESLGTIKRIAIDQETFNKLSIADVNSPEVTAFMERHGLKFGEDIILDIEGSEQASVVMTSENDFFTRDREATVALAEQSRLEQNEKEPSISVELDKIIGHTAIEASGIKTIDSVPEEETVSEKGPGQGHMQLFSERIGHIEENLKGRIRGYSNGINDTLSPLIQRSRNTENEINEIQVFLSRAEQGSLEYRTVITAVDDRLQSMRSMLYAEQAALGDFGRDTIRLSVDAANLKEGELPKEKSDSIAADASSQEAVNERTASLEGALQFTTETLMAVKNAISAAEDINSSQFNEVSRLISIVDQVRPAAFNGQLSARDVDELQQAVRGFSANNAESNGAHLMKIKTSLEGLAS